MKTIAIAAALALSACGLTQEGDLARGVIRDKGAQVYDEGLENALWLICSGMSVGAIRRRFGNDQKMADAYHTLCNPTVDIITVR